MAPRKTNIAVRRSLSFTTIPRPGAAREEASLTPHKGEGNAFARDVTAGLLGVPKRLPCIYFYDSQGAALFEEICTLDEYYLTRAEAEILQARAPSIADLYPRGALVAELGSGSAVKTRILLAALLRHGPVRYLPIDVSEEMLAETAQHLAQEFPLLDVEAVPGTYAEGLKRLTRHDGRPHLVLWLGSSIGNLHRVEAAAFLSNLRSKLRTSDRILIGFDLRKRRATLERAYDDGRGVTARFNLNLLTRINRELGGKFDLAAFRHIARYHSRPGRVEMYLESLKDQTVAIGSLNLTVHFTAGERIHTENSYKYSRQEIAQLASSAGLRIHSQWLDGKKRFALSLMERI